MKKLKIEFDVTVVEDMIQSFKLSRIREVVEELEWDDEDEED